jgi:outer membrane protein assembly factor BamB
MRFQPARLLFALLLLLSPAGWAGAAPAISVNPTSVDFGPVPVDDYSGEKVVTITNTGTDPLVISGVFTSGGNAPYDFDGEQSCTGAPIPPGRSCTIYLYFEPSAAGPRSTMLGIVSNAPDSPQIVASLTGTGTAPAISVNATSLSFGSVKVGSASDTQVITVTNTGAAPLVITAVTHTGGNAPGDYLGLQTCTGGSIAPGGTCTLRLVFKPTAIGLRTTNVVFQSNAINGPATVAVSGTGIDPAPPPPPGVAALGLNPNSLSFGSQPVGSETKPQNVLISSNGTAPLVINNVSITGAQAAEFKITAGGFGGSVGEGQNRVVSISFTPGAAGARAATLTIASNAPGGPQTVALTGISVGPAPPPSQWSVSQHDSRQSGLADAPLDPRGLSAWTLPLGSRPGSSPVIGGGAVYLGTEAGVLVSIDIASHTVRWNRSLGAPVRSAPALSEKAVLVSANGLQALNPADGSTLWTRPDIVAGDGVSPMVANGIAYIAARAASGSGVVMFAVRADTGANVWPAPAPLPAGFDAGTTAAAYPEIDLLFVGMGGPGPTTQPEARLGGVMALRLSDGAPAWAAPTTLAASPSPAGVSVGWVATTGTLPVPQPAVFVTAGATITAVRAATGAILWSRALPEKALQGPPVLSTAAAQGSTLYVAAASGNLYALDSTTGADAPGVTLTPVGPVVGSLALAGNTLFVPTSTGLVAVNVLTGARLWDSSLAQGAATGVAVAGDSPYLGTPDGLLVGFSR